MVNVILPQSIHAACQVEANALFPLETGGTFMGWWRDEQTVVVKEMIGPGPDALHEPTNFQPDQEWQLQEIARIYEMSGRRVTYLGDWHTHPNASWGYLSRTDQKVSRKIASSTDARCPKPLMALLSGVPENWNLDIWVTSLRPRRFLGKRLELVKPTISYV